MKPYESTIVACESCGLHRVAQHPIQYCYKCQHDEYERAFAALRQQSSHTHLLGVDVYSDIIYVWADGVVSGIEGRMDRFLRHRKTDELVSRITELEAENRDLLAENARFRRRLEKPTPRQSDAKGEE